MSSTRALHRALQQAPDSVLTVDGARTRTVRETVNRIARLAGALRAAGVAEGDRVAVLGVNSDRFHEAILATWWAGAVVNPVNTRWSVAEIGFSLRDCGSDVLVVDSAFGDILPRLREVYPLRVVIAVDAPASDGVLDFEELIATGDPIADARRDDGDLAGIFYTGGTTGRPKGVMIAHGNLQASSLGVQATSSNVTPGGATLVALPMFHLASLMLWNGQLVAGGRMVFLPGVDVPAVLDAIEAHRITSLVLVPTVMQQVVRELSARPRDVSSVRRLQYGAAPMAPSLLEHAMRAFPLAGFGQGYGMTETSANVTSLTPEDHRAGRLDSVGRASRHTEIIIADPEGRELPLGEVGEILVRGANVMLGYWNRPEETAAALRDGWMHTGDAGRLDDEGYLYLADRIKDMIITGGENVYSAEVEHALVEHPQVSSCAVIGVPDARYGERVHAVVIAEAGTDPRPDDLRSFVKARVAGYKAPRSFTFVTEFPLSPTGKVLKHELRRHWCPDLEQHVTVEHGAQA
ncbi:long-chain-fatty-acid--CoA ligase [Tsukamurella ocularis]|uniref:long-chain-fatty-acid--CoA ligase n=1 Tax=Tsukamurella ocularis TaxID=1970234 RepID=UPI0039EF176A